MSTLLDRARSAPPHISRRRKNITEQHIEVALMWAKGKLTSRQVAYAFNKRNAGGIYSMIALCLREHFTGGVSKK